MNLKIFLLVNLVAVATGEYTCNDADCHECTDSVCHLTCQGKSCRDCPSGDCCNGSSCNVCIASVCCSTAKCNRCVNKQRMACPDLTSSTLCISKVSEACGLSADDHISDRGNFNSGHHNITTIIKLRNLINNTNIVDVPIKLNITSANDMVLNRTSILLKSLERRNRNCCSIIHPQECHKFPLLPKEVCFTRKHKECSELCDHATNLLITISKTNRCITIAVHPYYYCGYYAIEDCSACFNCTNISHTGCLEEPTCSETCRSSIFPRRFYNVPYYIKTENEEPAVNKSDVLT